MIWCCFVLCFIMVLLGWCGVVVCLKFCGYWWFWGLCVVVECVSCGLTRGLAGLGRFCGFWLH